MKVFCDWLNVSHGKEKVLLDCDLLSMALVALSVVFCWCVNSLGNVGEGSAIEFRWLWENGMLQVQLCGVEDKQQTIN